MTSFLASICTRLSALAVGTLLLVVPALAQTKPCVVELFTSQGCSSCPPADAVLGSIAKTPGVIALSLPVDYWDYIGWKDTFASAQFTARQKSYANARGDGRVYTPQAVIDGIMHVVGSDSAGIARIADMSYGQSGAMTVPVSLSVRDKSFNIEIGKAGAEASMGGTVWLLRIAKSRSVTIGRGENHGHTLTYTNIVRDMTKLGEWTGGVTKYEAPLRGAGPTDADGAAVIVQAGSLAHPGVILGAALAP